MNSMIFLFILSYTMVVIVLVLAIHRNLTKKPRTQKVICLPDNFPSIVCLCGSTRFYKEFQLWNYVLTMQGKIVLSVGFYLHSTEEVHGESMECTEQNKIKLDNLHKRKIDLADEILVINPGGYIGDSTRSEMEYAKNKGKSIKFLEEY